MESIKPLIKFITIMLFGLFIFRWALGSWLNAFLITIATCILCALIVRIRNHEEELKQVKYSRKLHTDSSDNPLLRTRIDSLTGEGFEQYCVDLLLLAGYENIKTTPHTGDKGIDIICEKDGKKYGVQCKRYSSSVGVKAVQEAFAGAGYYECDVPVVITNNYYTDAATQMAEKIGVVLWDRELIEGIIQKVIRKTPEREMDDNGNHSATALKIVSACLALAIAVFAGYVVINNSFSSDEDDIDYSEYYDSTMVDDAYEGEPTKKSDDVGLEDDDTEESKVDLSDKTPYLLMREADLEKTKLGKPDAVEKSFGFDEMDLSHRSKEYTWGELENHTFFSVTIRYERHLSHKVDDIETYPENNGYVSEIYYYDSETGAYVREDEYDGWEE